MAAERGQNILSVTAETGAASSQPSRNWDSTITYLTFLQHCGLADLLCSHGELGLLLAGWHYGLEVIVAFLMSDLRGEKSTKIKQGISWKGAHDVSTVGHSLLPWWHPDASAQPACALVFVDPYKSLYMTARVCSHCLHHLVEIRSRVGLE